MNCHGRSEMVRIEYHTIFTRMPQFTMLRYLVCMDHNLRSFWAIIVQHLMIDMMHFRLSITNFFGSFPTAYFVLW
jgi:hypothetical protein